MGWGAATWHVEVSGVSERVLSEVSATVSPDREGEFLAGFEEPVSLPRPDRSLNTERCAARTESGESRDCGETFAPSC